AVGTLRGLSGAQRCLSIDFAPWRDNQNRKGMHNMKLSTKLASAIGAICLAGTGALAALSGGSAAATVPAVVHFASASQAAPSQVSPTPPPSGSTVDASGAEALDTGADAVTESANESANEPANEPQLPGGGHADAPGATADHQFEGVE
ncbi:MAG: hypothetical protein QOE07_2135, partial [Acidimicrobiaceae bacterium]|nr:hypothetical protein [Acidimicrobiaceae bacterium]